MNKRMTKVFSFAAIALLALGEGASFAYAVTEETTTSTSANEEVLKTQETDASIEEAAEASSEKVEEVKEEATEESTASSAEEPTEESTTSSTTESTEEKEEKKKKKETKANDPADPVTISDPTLHRMIRDELKATSGETVNENQTFTVEQMEKLTKLVRGTEDVDVVPITSLEGLQYAVNLESIDFCGTRTSVRFVDQFTELPSDFANLKNLKNLKFYNGFLRNISSLQGNTSLTHFSAVGNDLYSLEALSECTNLQYLNINADIKEINHPQNQDVKNFKGLEKATNLTSIYFQKGTGTGGGLETLEDLNCKGSLEKLYLDGHSNLASLNGLEDYTKLKELYVRGSADYTGWSSLYGLPSWSGDITVPLLFDRKAYPENVSIRGLRGTDAISALKSCSSLETVDLQGNAIENIVALSNKDSLTKLTISGNRIESLAPLKSTTKLESLDASRNLLENLDGLQNASKLKSLNVESQSSGALKYQIKINSDLESYTFKGILNDISGLNSTSLETVLLGNNQLENIESLKNASNLKTLSVQNNLLSDIKDQLNGCTNLTTVKMDNNQFVNFEDAGLNAAVNSLRTLSIREQGLIAEDLSGNPSNKQNDKALLENLDGLKDFKVLTDLDLNCNQIMDEDMVHIPVSIVNLKVSYNELQDKAFSSLKATDYQQLNWIEAHSNHISDITPLESLPALTTVSMTGQMINVPSHGGEIEYKTASGGFTAEVLKTNFSKGTSMNFYSGWLSSTPSYDEGTHTFDVDDPKYDIYGSAIAKFTVATNDKFSSFSYNGEIGFKVEYAKKTSVELELVPTNLAGEVITKIEQGGTIYWRAKLKSTNEEKLFKPKLSYNMVSTQYLHSIFTDYSNDEDSKVSEYSNGVRVDVNGAHISTAPGLWDNQYILHYNVNKDNIANITTVTKVSESATPGELAKFRINVSGENFEKRGLTAEVEVVAMAGQELKMSVPERLDFGKDNQADKKAKTYGLNAKGYSSTEKTKGLKIRVTDTKKTTSRTDWKVVGQLSDLTNTAAGKLENGTASPKLTIGNIGLLKVTNAGEASESTSPITTNASGKGNPTWATSIDLTAGGSSIRLAEAPKVDGEGVWDYTIPFDDVKLEVPANVNNQAGRTFNGKITWTLEDTL